MNLFRSEEHARNWVGFDESMAATLLPLESWAEIFSNPFFRSRPRDDYISWTRSDAGAAAYAILRSSMPRTQ